MRVIHQSELDCTFSFEINLLLSDVVKSVWKFAQTFGHVSVDVDIFGSLALNGTAFDEIIANYVISFCMENDVSVIRVCKSLVI